MDAADLPQERLHLLAGLHGLVHPRERAAEAGQPRDVGEQTHGQGQPLVLDVGALPLREPGRDLGAWAESAVGAGFGELADGCVGDRLLTSDPLQRKEPSEEPALLLQEVLAARAVGAVLDGDAHRIPPHRAVALRRCLGHCVITPVGLRAPRAGGLGPAAWSCIGSMGPFSRWFDKRELDKRPHLRANRHPTDDTIACARAGPPRPSHRQRRPRTRCRRSGRRLPRAARPRPPTPPDRRRGRQSRGRSRSRRPSSGWQLPEWSSGRSRGAAARTPSRAVFVGPGAETVDDCRHPREGGGIDAVHLGDEIEDTEPPAAHPSGARQLAQHVQADGVRERGEQPDVGIDRSWRHDSTGITRARRSTGQPRS